MGILKHVPKQIGDRVPKVYFSCHKDDFKPYFKEISEEIMNGRSCAVFYDEDYDGARDKEFLFDLSKMNLFVMPITTRLLTKPNRALDEELAFALEHKIPVLPLMQESGLEELFNKKFGDLQFLDKYNRDSTAISYDEKLNKYLSSVLLDDKTIKRIRAEFDAQIFLSYRKKDRIHANRLMRLIHKNDFCRDIAIWYDEFLTPGEDFNKTIAEALDKSDLFVLAVTPSLLEPRVDENGVKHKNYIEEHEYPMAVEAKKPILPTELVYTDKDALAVKYANVPDCVNADDESALTEALLNTAKKFVSDENDNSPEHNYLIGLAYLDGIDVEVDHARAREMIEYAANANYLEAIDKMIEMSMFGHGVIRRPSSAAMIWDLLKIKELKRRFQDKPNVNNSKILLENILGCGDYYATIGREDLRGKKYFQALSLCNDLQYKSKSRYRDLSVVYGRIGDYYCSKGDKDSIKIARYYYIKSCKMAKSLFKNAPTDIRALDMAITINKLGDIHQEKGNLKAAAKNFEYACSIIESLFKRNASKRVCDALISCYERLGALYNSPQGSTKDRIKAAKYYEKAIIIQEKLLSEKNSIATKFDLCYKYSCLAYIYRILGKADMVTKVEKKHKALAGRLRQDLIAKKILVLPEQMEFTLSQYDYLSCDEDQA